MKTDKSKQICVMQYIIGYSFVVPSEFKIKYADSIRKIWVISGYPVHV